MPMSNRFVLIYFPRWLSVYDIVLHLIYDYNYANCRSALPPCSSGPEACARQDISLPEADTAREASTAPDQNIGCTFVTLLVSSTTLVGDGVVSFFGSSSGLTGSALAQSSLSEHVRYRKEHVLSWG